MNVKPGKISIRRIKSKSIIDCHLSVHEKHGSKLTKFGGTSAMFSPIAVLRNDWDVSECWSAHFNAFWESCAVAFNVVE